MGLVDNWVHDNLNHVKHAKKVLADLKEKRKDKKFRLVQVDEKTWVEVEEK